MRFIEERTQPGAIVLRKQPESASHPFVLADDMRRTPMQERREIAPGQFVRRNIPQRDQAERCRGGARFLSSAVVETFGQLDVLCRTRQ